MAVREIDRRRDPLPAFGRDRLGLGLQLFGSETIEQRHILQPAAIVVCEQIPYDGAAGVLVSVKSDEWARRSEVRTVFSVSIRRI